MEIDLLNPEAYRSGQPYDQYRWLRENDPFHWHDIPGEEAGFFALTRYADLKSLESDYKVFSSSPTNTLFDVNTLGDDNHSLLMAVDPPQHTEHRNFLSRELTPQSVKDFRPHLERVVTDLINEVVETGECDLVADVGGKLASYVTADMMGLPRNLLVEIYEISDHINNSKSVTEGPGLDAVMKMGEHSKAIYDSRRSDPKEDMVSRMANGEYNGCPVDAMQFGIDFILIVGAGGDTTRNVVGGGMLALFERPDQRQKLLAEPSLIPSAVDEMIRWVSPIVYQRRTATVDTEFLGRKIKKGTKLAGYYGAANRDPRAFPNPDDFSIERSPNAHVGFGFGPHFCLGSHLARQELAILFRELFKRMPDIEPVGPAVWELPAGVAPTVVGPRSIPVRFTPGPKVHVS